MALKIRLRQMGRRNRLVYRLVIADSHSPRDGKYIEMVGYYNPHLSGNENINVIEDRIEYWLSCGAIMTEKAQNLIARAAPRVMKSFREKQRAKNLKRVAKRKKNK